MRSGVETETLCEDERGRVVEQKERKTGKEGEREEGREERGKKEDLSPRVSQTPQFAKERVRDGNNGKKEKCRETFLRDIQEYHQSHTMNLDLSPSPSEAFSPWP